MLLQRLVLERTPSWPLLRTTLKEVFDAGSAKKDSIPEDLEHHMSTQIRTVELAVLYSAILEA